MTAPLALILEGYRSSFDGPAHHSSGLQTHARALSVPACVWLQFIFLFFFGTAMAFYWHPVVCRRDLTRLVPAPG